MVLHEIVYEIDSPRQAFDALKSLSIVESEEELLRSAAFDEAGNLSGAKIPWSKSGNNVHSSWDNTLLGHLEIDGATLTVQTNSDNRARIIREIVETRLPGNARLRSDTITSQKDLSDKALKGDRSGPESGGPLSGPPPEMNPEMRVAMKEFLQKEIRQWAHTNVPMLGGKTPLEAVLTEDGRDLVESLLLDMEQREIGPGMRVDREIMAELRKALGLSEKPFRTSGLPD